MSEKKGKGKKKDLANSATAVTTSINNKIFEDQDIKELRKRLEEAQTQLLNEEKLIDQLTLENQSKNAELVAMEQAMTSEMEKHKASLDLLESEAETRQSETSLTIEVLERQVKTLQMNLGSYDVLEKTNISLRERVEDLMANMEKESTEHAEIIHQMRKDMFHYKTTLEETFRKTLKDLDGEYLKRTFGALSEKSKNALTANAKLKEELFIQSNGVENLMHRFLSQRSQYHKLKVENEILEKGSSVRVKEVAQLKRRQYEYECKISNLQSMVQQNHAQVSTDTQAEVRRLELQVAHYKSLFEKSEDRCLKWKLKAAEVEARRPNPSSRRKTPTFVPKNILPTSEKEVPEVMPARLGVSIKDKNPIDSMWLASTDPREEKIDRQRLTKAVLGSQHMSTLMMSRSTSAPSFDQSAMQRYDIDIPLRVSTAVPRVKGPIFRQKLAAHGLHV